MTRRMRLLLRLGIAVLLAVATAGLFLITASPGAAAVGGLELDVAGAGFTGSPTTALIDVSHLMPGSATSGVLGVRNATTDAGSITVRIIDVGPGGGAGALLESALVFTVSSSPDGVAPYTPVWTGSAAQLQTGVQTIAALAGGGTGWLTVSATLPLATGNATQGATYLFVIQVDLAGQGEGGPIIPPVQSEIAGLQIGPNLATTGFDVALFVALGVLAILGGVLILVRARAAREQ